MFTEAGVAVKSAISDRALTGKLNPTLDGGVPSPTIFFVIMLITANYMVPNTYNFPNIILI